MVNISTYGFTPLPFLDLPPPPALMATPHLTELFKQAPRAHYWRSVPPHLRLRPASKNRRGRETPAAI